MTSDDYLRDMIREQAIAIAALSTALRDAISTYGDKDEIVVTAERQEAWQAVLDRHGAKGKDSP